MPDSRWPRASRGSTDPSCLAWLEQRLAKQVVSHVLRGLAVEQLLERQDFEEDVPEAEHITLPSIWASPRASSGAM